LISLFLYEERFLKGNLHLNLLKESNTGRSSHFFNQALSDGKVERRVDKKFVYPGEVLKGINKNGQIVVIS
jgi:hypothetical protein